MKRTNIPFAAVLAAAVLVSAFALASCVSSWSDGGYLVIGFGGGRNVSWPPGPEEVARMVIKVTLDGPGGARSVQVEGNTSVTVPVSPGRWRIDSKAYVDDKLRAVGDTEYLQVKEGRNNVNVTLRRPPALSLGAGGTHTFPARTAGYAAAPSAHTVTVSNEGSVSSGDLAVSLSGAGASAFVLSRTSLPGLAAKGSSAASASFTVRPKPGVGVGTYAGTVTVSGEDMDESFDVGFRVLNDNTNLMAKFGVAGTGAAAVTETFTAIHNYLATISAADLEDADSPIKLGDWIDLPSLTVAAYGSGGSEADRGAISIPDPSAQTNTKILRIIVVGRNSFNNKNGNGTGPHLVFQFLNLPGTRRMEGANDNGNGYLDSVMRQYLVENYLTGLTAAGVPEALLWAPSRRVAKRGSGATGTHTITDKLWLPTEWEMFGAVTKSVGAWETGVNQAHLAYYTSDDLRKKYPAASISSADWYWEASPDSSSLTSFCNIRDDGHATAIIATAVGGVAPAFCVK